MKSQREELSTTKSQTNSRSFSIRTAGINEAETIFNRAGIRSLSLNFWSKIFNRQSGCLHLFNGHGNLVNRLIKMNDYMRITVSEPGKTATEAYQWVKIKVIEAYTDNSIELDLFSIMLIPALQPGNTQNSDPQEVGITFTLKREVAKVSVELHSNTDIFLADELQTHGSLHPGTSLHNITAPQWNKLSTGLLT